MKKLIFLLSAASVLFTLISCKPSADTTDTAATPEEKTPAETEFEKMYKAAVQSYTSTDGDFTITAKDTTPDKIYVKSEKEIILLSTADVDAGDKEPKYSLSGTYEGQIRNITKGAVLNLEGVILTNTSAPAIYGEKKIELSAKKKTVNKITVTGTSEEKIAAVQCAKKIEIGGAGELIINSSLFHGIKGDEINIKGSGTITVDGNNTDGSAVNCNVFAVKAGKTFKVTFKNFKHAIKADDYIDIKSGNFTIGENIQVPFKTNVNEEETHYITVKKIENRKTDDGYEYDEDETADIDSGDLVIANDVLTLKADSSLLTTDICLTNSGKLKIDSAAIVE